MFPGTTITTAVFILFPLTLYLAAATTTDIQDYSALSCKATSSVDLFSANSTYAANLKSLLLSLNNSAGYDYGQGGFGEASLTTGFANATSGSTPSNTVYGLALCRGDASSEICTTCISLAISSLSANCSGIKEAIVWREWCMLRYANRHILSSLEFDPAFTLNDVGNAVVAGFGWKQALNFTLNNVTGIAAAATGGKKFATKKAAYKAPNNKVTEIYSMAQCTPDLTAADCSRCLLVAMRKLPLQYEAGIVLLPSCHIRYEPHPFYQNSSASEPLQLPPPVPESAPPPPPAKPHPHPGPIPPKVIISAGATVIGIVALLLTGRWYYERSNGNPINGSQDVNMTGNPSDESLQKDLDQLFAELLLMNFVEVRDATDLDIDRELGEGDFEKLFTGKLPNGLEIHAKRLSGSRHGQPPKQFIKEVSVMAKIQHRNLAKLLGFCQKDEDKFLVYESPPNSSTLEKVFFDDPIKRASLGWEKRFNIICGIAKGLLYLHHDSRLMIIHRDLKPSSILLDQEAMNPQISDFGKAKILKLDQTDQASSDMPTAAKTHAYMAPEYKSTGKYSFKSDIYSFGIIVLEIVTGQRNYDGEDRSPPDESMLHRARRLWSDNKKVEIIDSTLKEDYSIEEVVKCIHIGLLCIQEDDEKRPTMTSIEAVLIGIGKSADLPPVECGGDTA